MFLLHVVPAGATIVALALLACGVACRSQKVTRLALATLIAAGVVGLPMLLRADAIAALLGLESTAAVALSVIVVWRGTSRYPMFAAVATLVLGIAAATLLVQACVVPL